MFKAIKRVFEKVQTAFSDKVVDPSIFNDDLALKTSWSALETAFSASFRTHKLIMISPDRIEFRRITFPKIWNYIFIFIGLLVAFIFFKLAWLSALGGLFVAIICLIDLFSREIPIVFDKSRGFLGNKRQTENHLFDSANGKAVPLSHIYSLQIITEHHKSTGGDGGYRSYQLNLILQDATRVSVINHGDQNKTREDAKQLAQFLQKPLWDAS